MQHAQYTLKNTPERNSSNMIANERLKLNHDIKLKTKSISFKLTDSNFNITLANLKRLNQCS